MATSETTFSSIRTTSQVRKTSGDLTFEGSAEIYPDGRVSINGTINSPMYSVTLNYGEESNNKINRGFNGEKSIEDAAWALLDSIVADCKAKFPVLEVNSNPTTV